MTFSPPETHQCKAADDTSSAMLVWDLPLRLFHWGLVVSVFVSVGSAKTGVMFVHEKSGLTSSIVLPLVILIPYLAFILLVEGNYIYDVMFEGFVSWNF